MRNEDGLVFAGYTELKIKGVYPSLREQVGVTDAECQKTESIREYPRFIPDRESRRWGIGSELFSSVLCRIGRRGKPPPHPSPLRRALISYWGHWEAHPECICIDLHISHQALLVAFLRKTRIGGMMISLAGNGHIYYPSLYLYLFFIFFQMPARHPPPDSFPCFSSLHIISCFCSHSVFFSSASHSCGSSRHPEPKNRSIV